LFLLVTTYDGKIHLLRLPDPLNPMKKEEAAPPAQTENVQNPPAEPSVSNFLKSEIDHIEHKVL